MHNVQEDQMELHYGKHGIQYYFDFDNKHTKSEDILAYFALAGQ